MDQERVKKLVRELIIEIGEDPTREGLKDTPERIGQMYKEIFGGYESDSELSVQFSEDSDTVVARDIQFPTSGTTSNDSATLKETAKDITITITASIAYQIQCGNDSFGIWILS